MCTRCQSLPAVVETWGYEEHSVYCLTCAADDLAENWHWRLGTGSPWQPLRAQRVLEGYSDTILAVIGGMPDAHKRLSG